MSGYADNLSDIFHKQGQRKFTVMSERQISDHHAFYLNPVSAHPFADPFVLKHCGEYWAYSTGFWRDGRCFGILHSRDLVHWEEVGGAMEPLPGGHTCYWAPEVSYDNGKYLLYYSVGNEERMQIRVAVADHPAGPFIDSGWRLTNEEFAIDPHVFVDDNGAKYLFYATDFLAHTHIGTGTVMDRMVDWFTLAGNPRPVTRARYDWQVYDPQRASKGGVRWHTVEGPWVVKRKGLYYQMFSGGNWQNISYGVSYAFTDNLTTTDEWQQVSDGANVPPILRTLPGKVIGPGHNSAVRGPDNQQIFCVYHRWAEDGSARLMCIDRLDWTGQEMIVLGPSAIPQPVPIAPMFADFFDGDRGESLGENWKCVGGDWVTCSGCAVQDGQTENASEAEAHARVSAPCFVAEVSIQCLRYDAEYAGCGISVWSAPGLMLRVLLLPGQNCLSILVNGSEAERLPLPSEFNTQSFHLFRIEIDELRARMQVDQGPLRWEGRLPAATLTIALSTRQASAAFAGFALTAGWEDLFRQQNYDPADSGWRIESGDWIVSGGLLQQKDQQTDGLIVKPLSLASATASYELAVNVRLVSVGRADAGYGIYFSSEDRALGLLISVRRLGDYWSLVVEGSSLQKFALPDGFNPNDFQQFRFRNADNRLQLNLASLPLGEVKCESGMTLLGLVSRQASVSFDMVRVTALTMP
ncbi:MAG: glycoside hydrolase family 43 protein [Acidobacteriota bacterium]